MDFSKAQLGITGESFSNDEMDFNAIGAPRPVARPVIRPKVTSAPKPAATPKVTSAPKPAATPKVTSAPKPAATPKPAAKPLLSAKKPLLQDKPATTSSNTGSSLTSNIRELFGQTKTPSVKPQVKPEISDKPADEPNSTANQGGLAGRLGNLLGLRKDEAPAPKESDVTDEPIDETVNSEREQRRAERQQSRKERKEERGKEGGFGNALRNLLSGDTAEKPLIQNPSSSDNDESEPDSSIEPVISQQEASEPKDEPVSAPTPQMPPVANTIVGNILTPVTDLFGLGDSSPEKTALSGDEILGEQLAEQPGEAVPGGGGGGGGGAAPMEEEEQVEQQLAQEQVPQRRNILVPIIIGVGLLALGYWAVKTKKINLKTFKIK